MAIYGPDPGFKGGTFELWVLNRWDLNFSVGSSPLQEEGEGTRGGKRRTSKRKRRKEE